MFSRMPTAKTKPKPKPEPKIGRPKIAEEAKRSTLVRVLTTAAEYEELKQAAESDSVTVSTWMRSIALRKARTGTA